MAAAFPRLNRLLSRFPPETLAALTSHSEDVILQRGEVLYGQGERIESFCFPAAGVVSQYQVSAGGRRIEVAMIGREGMTGMALLLGVDRSPEEACVVVGGEAVRVDASALLEVSRSYPAVRDLLLRYVQASAVQKANTALSHGLDTLERRLGRWLLMSHDRMQGDDLPLTHDQLSTALGVRRSGVTSALHVLEGERLVRAVRGKVTVLDREGLKTLVGDSYGAPEAEYERLLGEGAVAVVEQPPCRSQRARTDALESAGH